MIHALSGGVGGAKLAVGLAAVLPPEELTIIVNTADDFDYLGLHVMPDLDSVLYALAGLNDSVRGWGRAGETWACKQAISELGIDNWFALGDKDLALHILRTDWLRQGWPYSRVAGELARRMGIAHRVLPMSDEPVATVVLSEGQRLPFQEYFVRLQCVPRASGFEFAGAEKARPQAEWLAQMDACQGTVICPSNPYVSVAPILALTEVKEALANQPVVAVSPIVGGRALKGPAAKMMAELGQDASPVGVARCYAGLLDGMVIDVEDEQHASELERMGLKVCVTQTIMKGREDSIALAQATLELLRQCKGQA
jgi:LPPG:FO 2-phospho-L-lactate transferase